MSNLKRGTTSTQSALATTTGSDLPPSTQKRSRPHSLAVTAATATATATATADDPLKAVVTFWSKKRDFQSLSNFYPCKVAVTFATTSGDRDNTITYNSGEAAFHGEKFRLLGCLAEAVDVDEARRLLQHSRLFLTCSPLEAKQQGGKWNPRTNKGCDLTTHQRAIWDTTLALQVQEHICRWKAEHCAQVRSDLKASGKRLLVHTASRTSLADMPSRRWEGKAVLNSHGSVEVIGGNELGKLWMLIRDEMKA